MELVASSIATLLVGCVDYICRPIGLVLIDMAWIARLLKRPTNRPFFIVNDYYIVKRKYADSDTMIVATNHKGQSETLTRRQAEDSFDTRIQVDLDDVKDLTEKIPKAVEEERLKRILKGI